MGDGTVRGLRPGDLLEPATTVHPDGVVSAPDGTIVGMLNPDGFIGALPPPGANLFTGTTLKQGPQGFGPQVVMSAGGKVLGKLRPENNMVIGPDGQTGIGIRGPSGNIRYASVADLDPSRGPPKALGNKAYRLPKGERLRAGASVPRCCGIPLGQIAKKFSNPITWTAL